MIRYRCWLKDDDIAPGVDHEDEVDRIRRAMKYDV